MSRRKREHGGTRTLLSAKGVDVRGLGVSEASVEPAVEAAELHLSSGLFQRTTRLIKAHWIASAIIALALFTTAALALKYMDDDAKRQRALGSQASRDSTWLNSVNPFASAPLPSPTPQLSKEYIYAGSRLLAVEDANAAAAPPADLAVWRPTNGYFYVLGGTGSAQVFVPWGTSGDTPVQGDFDGDGKTDFSVFRPPAQSSPAVWWIMKSSTLDTEYYSVPFGATDDVPAQADFDGDGKTDVAVWRPSTGVWYIIASSTGATQYATYGANGDKPAPADYDGDGRADIAVWRPGNHTFYSVNSSNAQSSGASFGASGDTPVCADYDGDGRANYALRSGASWIILNAALTQTTTTTPSGDLATDTAVQNDYDGDGRVDIAVWRGSNGTWYIRQSASNNSLRQVQWGMTGDIPVAAFFRR